MNPKASLMQHWPIIISHLLLILITLFIPGMFNWSIDTWESFQLIPLVTLMALLFILQQFYFLFTNQRTMTLISTPKALLLYEIVYAVLAIFYWSQTLGLTRYLVFIHWALVHSYIVSQSIHPLLSVVVFGLQLTLFQANLNEAIGKIIATGWLNLTSSCLLIAIYLIIASKTLPFVGSWKPRLLMISFLLLVIATGVSHFLTAFTLMQTLLSIFVPLLLTIGVLFLLQHPLTKRHQTK
ncbi:MAG: hypothetical protein Q4A67_03445 [Aerococcus sp.]|nr:hypothetical protein [Aerococcus sp.]